MPLSIDTSRDLVVKLDISVRSPTIPTHSLFPSPLMLQFTLITSVPYDIINPVPVDPDVLSGEPQPQDSLCVKVEFVPTAPSASEAGTTTSSDETRVRRNLLFLRPLAVTAVPGVYKLRVSVSVCLSTEQQTCYCLGVVSSDRRL
jgi:hypothetical protein